MRTKQILTKTVLLLACMLMGAGTAWAADETITFSDKGYQNGESVAATPIKGTDFTITFSTGSNTNPPKYYTTGAAIRAYGGNTMTVSSTTKTIEKIELSFSSGENSNAITVDGGTYNNGTWTGSATSVIFTIGGTTGHRRIASVAVTYASGTNTPTCADPTFSPAAGTYTSAQNITISTTTEDATIYYTTDGTAPSTNSNVYSAPINVSETTTIKAIAVKADYNNSAVASASYTIINIEHNGTEADPYTVADARTAIDANTGLTEVFATGIVSSIITAYNSSYGNITFDISTDGLTTSAQLRAYRCEGTTDADASEVQVGDVVVIMGNLTKYGDTYEFAQDCQLISIQHPAVPTIVASPSSLSDFTYEESNGPSAIKTISVSGSNLTSNISLSLGESSNFEMSLSEGSDYTNSLTLTPEEGVVSATTIYVRLKAGLDVESYSGTITLASTDANNVTVSLSGSVTEPEAPNVTWDLSTDQTATATEDEMSWTSSYATMTVDKGSSTTNVNNYYPGTSGKTYTSTRFYKNSLLTITPATGFAITSVKFTATSEGYASTLKSSDWTNAIAEVSGTTVTVTPIVGTEAISATIGGTCGFTMVKVYYEVPAASAPVWSALPTPTLNVGEDYELNLTTYVSGYPFPEISLTTGGDIADFDADDNNYFYFNPTNSGTFEFTFTATNSEGSADATLTVTVAKPSATIVVDKNIVEATAAETNGTIEVTYSYTSTETEPEIVWYTDETATTTTDEPSWISADFDEDKNIDYLIDANDGAARTAYMKVYALDNDAQDVYSELITINQAEFEVDYAELPFEFDGGKADIEDTSGMTQSGLAKDYSSAPYLKFDGTDDYVILKINERPGKLTFDIQGNGFSGSTFTVQTSVDGENYTDLATYTELGTTQSEEFNNLAEDVRFIKWVYTEKVNGNVALGNIKLAAYVDTPEPQQFTLTVEPFENLEIITFVNDEMVMEEDGDIQVNEGDQIMLSIVASEGYVMETLMVNGVNHVNDIADDFTYSFEMPDEDVTISATAVEYVAPTLGEWVLTDLEDLTEDDVFVIVGDNGDTYAMSNDEGTVKAPVAVAVTVVGNTLSGTIDDNLMWNVSVNEDGYTFYPNGNHEVWLYCTDTNNGVRVGTNTNNVFTEDEGYLKNGATSRYVGIYNSSDWRCYTSTTVNITYQTFSFYKKVSEVETITISAAGYATYCSENALDFSNTGLTAYQAIKTGSEVSFTPVTEVPAEEGVLLKGAEGTYSVPVIASTTANFDDNYFVGVTEETEKEAGIFVLMNPEGGKGVGFYQTKNAFTVGANTAYLPATAGARSFIAIDEATGIDGIAAKTMGNGQIFNLQGQRVTKAQKGLYIMDGKKVVMK